MSIATSNTPLAPDRSWIPAFLLVAVAYMLFLTIDQAHWWQLKADYSFGWLVPVFVAYLVYERWPLLKACVRPAVASPLPSWRQRAVALVASGTLAAGLAFFAMGALYRAGSGPSQPGSLAMATGFALTLPAMACLSVPAGGVMREGGPAGPVVRDARLRVVGLLVFPALVWLISAPLVSAVENAVSLYLLRKVVAVVFFLFDFLGYPLVREGNVLMLPRGQVGVADACSGIRSLTGCLFAGSFLAAVFLNGFWKKVMLIGLALALAFATNLLRSLFLTGWAYAYGSHAIEGNLHDATGYAVLGLTSLGLFCILPLFRRSFWLRFAA